jgi:pimeloyl-ACP methyl ester carboxylesterase
VEVERPAWLDRSAYPFEPRFVALEPGRMHLVDEGVGPPIVFLHGTPSWSFEFRKVIQALEGTHRCIAPDLLGFGLSEKPDAFDHTLASHARALEQLLERLKLDRFTLYVHDFGGPIGLRFAERHPERIERLVISNSWMWPLTEERRFAWMSRLMATGLGRYLYTKRNLSVSVLLRSSWVNEATRTPEVLRHYEQPFATVESRRATWTFARQLLEGTPFLESLWADREQLAAIPTLLLWGVKDPAFGARELARFRATFPRAQVKALAGVGHFPPEEAPDEVIAALRTFLAAAAGSREGA